MEGMYSAIVENFDGSVSHRTDEESVVIIKRALKQVRGYCCAIAIA
jgi:hypothetical protein